MTTSRPEGAREGYTERYFINLADSTSSFFVLSSSPIGAQCDMQGAPEAARQRRGSDLAGAHAALDTNKSASQKARENDCLYGERPNDCYTVRVRQ